MGINMLRGLGVVPLLWRLLKTLTSISLELAKIQETMMLDLKLKLIQGDIRMEDLKAAVEELGGADTPMDVLMQTDEDFAELERMEIDRRKAGGDVGPETDLEALLRDEGGEG